jgi:hypothetical protein
MKTAICFYGMLRTNKAVSSSIRRNLIEPLNGDVFICCPDVFFSVLAKDPIRSQPNPEKVSANYLSGAFGPTLKGHHIINNDPDIYKRIVGEKNLPETETLIIEEGNPNQWTWTGHTYRSLSMFYQIKQTIELMEGYEEREGIKYDCVILLRPDLDIKNLTVIDHLDLNFLYTSGNHLAPIIGTDKRIGDHLLVSKRDNILKLKTLYDDIGNYHLEGIKINNETLIGWHLIKNDVEFLFDKFSDHIIERGDVS